MVDREAVAQVVDERRHARAPPQPASQQGEEGADADHHRPDEEQGAEEPRGRRAQQADHREGRHPTPLVAPEVDDLGPQQLGAAHAGTLAQVLHPQEIAAARRQDHVEGEADHQRAVGLAVREREQGAHHDPPAQRLQPHQDETAAGGEQKRLQGYVVDGGDQLALRDPQVGADSGCRGQPGAEPDESAHPEPANPLGRRGARDCLAHKRPASSPRRRRVIGACGSERQASKHFPQFGPS